MATLRLYKCNILPYIIIFISWGDASNDVAAVVEQETIFLDTVRLRKKMTVGFGHHESSKHSRRIMARRRANESFTDVSPCPVESQIRIVKFHSLVAVPWTTVKCN
jgi:hypothetical protein